MSQGSLTEIITCWHSREVLRRATAGLEAVKRDQDEECQYTNTNLDSVGEETNYAGRGCHAEVL